MSNIFWPASPKQMLDSCRASAQAVGAAPSGGSASAAAPMRPASCGDGHGTTGADCRQDRRGTRSGFGVAAFSRTARSGAASGAASVRQGPVSAPPDGVASRRDVRRSPVRVFGPLPVLPEGGCFCVGARTVLGHCSESSQADEDPAVMTSAGPSTRCSRPMEPGCPGHVPHPWIGVAIADAAQEPTPDLIRGRG